MRLRVKKISASACPQCPPAGWEGYQPGELNSGQFSLPIDYEVEGEAALLPEVGARFSMLRDKRNGVEVMGHFETTTVMARGRGELGSHIGWFVTRNSVYRYEILK